LELIRFQNVNVNSLLQAVVGFTLIVIVLEIIDKITNPPPPSFNIPLYPQAKQKRKEFSESTKKDVLLRQGYRCNSCKMFLAERDFHHFNRNTSDNRSSNCEALCPNCHARKTRKKRIFLGSC